MASLSSERRLLVLLDIDNTMIHSVGCPVIGAPEPAFVATLGDDPFFVYKRPGLDSFLDYVFEHYRVGVWTAALPEYAYLMCHHIIPERHYHKLECILTNRECMIQKDAKGNSVTLKILHMIPWIPLERAVLVDDSRIATQLSRANTIHVDPFYAEVHMISSSKQYDAAHELSMVAKFCNYLASCLEKDRSFSVHSTLSQDQFAVSGSWKINVRFSPCPITMQKYRAQKEQRFVTATASVSALLGSTSAAPMDIDDYGAGVDDKDAAPAVNDDESSGEDNDNDDDTRLRSLSSSWFIVSRRMVPPARSPLPPSIPIPIPIPDHDQSSEPGNAGRHPRTEFDRVVRWQEKNSHFNDGNASENFNFLPKLNFFNTPNKHTSPVSHPLSTQATAPTLVSTPAFATSQLTFPVLSHSTTTTTTQQTRTHPHTNSAIVFPAFRFLASPASYRTSNEQQRQ